MLLDPNGMFLDHYKGTKFQNGFSPAYQQHDLQLPPVVQVKFALGPLCSWTIIKGQNFRMVFSHLIGSMFYNSPLWFRSNFLWARIPPGVMRLKLPATKISVLDYYCEWFGMEKILP